MLHPTLQRQGYLAASIAFLFHLICFCFQRLQPFPLRLRWLLETQRSVSPCPAPLADQVPGPDASPFLCPLLACVSSVTLWTLVCLPSFALLPHNWQRFNASDVERGVFLSLEDWDLGHQQTGKILNIYPVCVVMPHPGARKIRIQALSGPIFTCRTAHV